MLLPPCHSGGVTHHVGNEQLWYRARIRALSVPGPWVLWYNVGPPNDSEVGEHNSNNYGFMILITYNYSIYRGDTPAYNCGLHCMNRSSKHWEYTQNTSNI